MLEIIVGLCIIKLVNVFFPELSDQHDSIIFVIDPLQNANADGEIEHLWEM